MTNQQGAPEALRLAAEVLDWMPTSDTQRALWDRHQEALAVVKAALVDARQPAAHVQNPAVIEHVAGDVSKNDGGSNMAQQPAPSAASKAVLAAIRAANMQLVQTGDDEFMLVKYKNAEAQCDGGKCGIGGYCEQCPAARAPADSVTAPAGGAVAEVMMAIRPPKASPAWLPHKIIHASLQWLDSVPVGTKLYATPPAQAADSVLEDAARWRALPAFFEEYQIDAMKLYRDIDAYLDAARKQGANLD